MSSCLPCIVPCNFCTFKQNSNTECRKYFAVCCLQNSEQRMLHQGHISSTGARFLNHSWFWVIPNKIFSPHHKSWLILCFFLSMTNISILHISERVQVRLETKTEVTAADSSRAKTTKYQNISIIVVIIIIIINVMPNLSYFSRTGRFWCDWEF